MHTDENAEPVAPPAGCSRHLPPELVVRPFQRGDQEAARSLVLRGLGEHFGFVDETLNSDLDDIAAHYVDAGHLFFVAELAGQIVGTAGLLREAPAAARIVRMSVDQGVRRRGVASALVDACRQAARDCGAHELRAFTEPHWPDALGFYTSLGFTEYGRDPIDVHLRLSLGPLSS